MQQTIISKHVELAVSLALKILPLLVSSADTTMFGSLVDTSSLKADAGEASSTGSCLSSSISIFSVAVLSILHYRQSGRQLLFGSGEISNRKYKVEINVQTDMLFYLQNVIRE